MRITRSGTPFVLRDPPGGLAGVGVGDGVGGPTEPFFKITHVHVLFLRPQTPPIPSHSRAPPRNISIDRPDAAVQKYSHQSAKPLGTVTPMNQVSTTTQQLLPPGELVSELDLGSGHRGRAKQALHIEVVRVLTESDLPAIQSPPTDIVGFQVVKNLRSSHHRLAELIAAGRPPAEISIITGYSASWISGLRGDPAFNELVAYYECQKKSIFADAMERLKSLGLDAIEKLHERLNDETKNWTNKELMDLVDMSLVAPTQAKVMPGAGGSVPGASLQLEVKFVGAGPGSGPVFDGKFTDVTPKQDQ